MVKTMVSGEDFPLNQSNDTTSFTARNSHGFLSASRWLASRQAALVEFR